MQDVREREREEERVEKEVTMEPGVSWLWVLSWFGFCRARPEQTLDSSSPLHTPQYLPGCQPGRLLVSLSNKARAVCPL